MIMLFSFMIVSFLIATIFIILNFLISKKPFFNREKPSPFECGFDPLSPSRIPFSIQFFMISLIFLIFDVEIALLMPLILMFKFMNKTLIITSLIFMILLILGLFLEYMEKSIDWKY